MQKIQIKKSEKGGGITMNSEIKTLTINDCPDLLTVNEVAQILRVSEKTAYALVRGEKIKSVVISSRIYRIRKSDLISYIMGNCA